MAKQTTKPDASTWTLVLRPVPRDDDPDGVRRVRAALKALLRSYGLRCVGIGGAESQVEDTTADAPSGERGERRGIPRGIGSSPAEPCRGGPGSPGVARDAKCKLELYEDERGLGKWVKSNSSPRHG
jgi:hypothetical protein